MTKNMMKNSSLLTSVTANIEFNFPLAITTLKQAFENDSTDNIEGIYQFPLPKEAGFISFKTTLNDVVYQGEIKGKSVAENDYEEAISSGDTSILVEKIEDGLYQINVGNLLPGDTVLFELTLATLMTLTPNSARYYLPTVIANYYGRSYLDDLNTPKTNFLAEYPFTGTVDVGDDLQAQRLESAFNLKPKGNQTYDFSGYLDQDFVINVALSPIQQAKAIYSDNGDNEYTAMATIPAIKSLTVQNANVQLLVDCSGSMSGDSINQAREGMLCLFSLFNAQDHINLFRFGSTFDQILSGWEAFEGKAKSTLRRAISSLRADLGGTQLLEALEQTLNNAKAKTQSDILLITDGEIWGDKSLLDSLIQKSMKAKCRVSVIGLGNSVNESLLSNIANKTGGFSTFINPNENITQQITTLLAQIKSARGSQTFDLLPHHTWKKTPTYFVNQMPSMAYFMGKEAPENNLICAQGNSHDIEDGELEIQLKEQSIAWHKVTGIYAKALNAITVTQRMFEAPEQEKSLLATSYQQISDLTSFIMVAEREEKQNSLPKLQQVPQMQVNASMFSQKLSRKVNSLRNEYMPLMQASKPAPPRSSSKSAYNEIHVNESQAPMDYEVDTYLDTPSFLRKEVHDDDIFNNIELNTKSNDVFSLLHMLNDDECFKLGQMRVPTISDLIRMGLNDEIIAAFKKAIKDISREETPAVIADILYSLNLRNHKILNDDIADFLLSKLQYEIVSVKSKLLILRLLETVDRPF